MFYDYTVGICRHDWAKSEIIDLFNWPFMDLLYTAQTVHRRYFNPNEVQECILHSIKTGLCPEDCSYCSQSGHHNANIEKQKLLPIEETLAAAKKAKAAGATRFCMGAAWRGPPEKDLSTVLETIKQVKDMGLETCATLGMLTAEQTKQLAEAGLDYYNHNLDTSPEYYGKITSTRTYQDRLDTLAHVREYGINVCCGGIVGLGEAREDRAGLLQQLANLPEHPQSVPINMLIPMPGTPLENATPLDPFEFIRTVAMARIMMPKSFVRLSAGRTEMSQEMQAWTFFAGVNSIFLGEKLLTADNPDMNDDRQLFAELGMKSLDLNAYNAATTAGEECA